MDWWQWLAVAASDHRGVVLPLVDHGRSVELRRVCLPQASDGNRHASPDGQSTIMPCIMPERLASTDPFTQVTEMVGSGPYRFLAAEFDAGVRATYERFAAYVPRDGG